MEQFYINQSQYLAKFLSTFKISVNYTFCIMSDVTASIISKSKQKEYQLLSGKLRPVLNRRLCLRTGRNFIWIFGPATLKKCVVLIVVLCLFSILFSSYFLHSPISRLVSKLPITEQYKSKDRLHLSWLKMSLK